MLQGGSSASVGGGGAAAMGLRWQQLWQCLAPVVKVATVVAWGWCSCDGEGAACIHVREVGVVMVW